MASAALTSWRGHRLVRIGELTKVHETIRDPGPGRKWNTEQLNRSLVLATAAEFQGFARDLHDLSVDAFVQLASSGNTTLGDVIRARLTGDRLLDKGNAHPGALGSDFGRLGLALWPALEARDKRNAQRNHHLAALNDARNAIAHAHEAKLADVVARGYAIKLKTVKRWLSSLDALAGTMDAVTSAHLAHLFSVSPPW